MPSNHQDNHHYEAYKKDLLHCHCSRPKCCKNKGRQCDGLHQCQNQGDKQQKQGQKQGNQEQRQDQGHGDQHLDQSQGEQKQQQDQGHGDQHLDQSQGEQKQQQEQGHGDQHLDQSQGEQKQQQEQGHGDQHLDQSQGEQKQQQEQGHGDQHLDQSQGEQKQQQKQGHGDQRLDQSLGPQEQNQDQHHGNQQLDQNLGAQEQHQDQHHGNQDQSLGNQTQSQSQGEQEQGNLGPQVQRQQHGNQENGDQTNRGHTNTSPLENTQMISTPVDVDGVTVNVHCGGCFSKEERPKKDEKESKIYVDCCKTSLCQLLQQVNDFQQIQVNQGIDIYFSTPTAFSNPTENQEILNVLDCNIVKLKSADQTAVIPNTTVQLCHIAGIGASLSTESPDVFDFLMAQASVEEDEIRKCEYHCNKCALAMAKELACTVNFGLNIEVSIQGVANPFSLYVLQVKEGLVYFVDDLEEPTKIYIFTSCAVLGFNVPPQVIGALSE